MMFRQIAWFGLNTAWHRWLTALMKNLKEKFDIKKTDVFTFLQRADW